MKCADCAFFWKEEDERYPVCHFDSKGWFDIPPCDEPDEDEPEDYPDEY